MKFLDAYADSSRFKTHPVPKTDFQFPQLSKFENMDFKIWLGIIGIDEFEITQDLIVAERMILDFKEQKKLKIEGAFPPAQIAGFVSKWLLEVEVEKFYVAQVEGCEVWQLVPHVPTLQEFEKVYPSLTLDFSPPMQPVKKAKAEKKKVVVDVGTLDLFGALA